MRVAAAFLSSLATVVQIARTGGRHRYPPLVVAPSRTPKEPCHTGRHLAAWRAMLLLLPLAILPTDGDAAPASQLQLAYNPELDLHTIHFTGEIKRGSFAGLDKLIDEAARKNMDRQVFLSLHSPGGLLERPWRLDGGFGIVASVRCFFRAPTATAPAP